MALEKSSGSEMYLPMRQCPSYGSWDLVVRSALPFAALAANVDASLRPIAPDLPKGGTIYGLISYSVNRRTQEIGIRMALGATTYDVQSRIVWPTIGLTTVGMVLGVIASWGLARSVRSLLFGVTYGDPLTFVAAALVLMTIAILAGYLPARRASRIDPMICLRAD